MNLTCAAGILCGAESPGLPSPPQHKCMFCGDGLHGGICGRLYEEIVKDRSFVGLPDCLNDRAKGLTNSVGAIMCNLCIQTNLRQQDRTTGVTTKNNDMATNDASFIPNEASISGTSTTSTSRSDDTNSAQVLSADISLPEQIVPSIDADAVNKLFKEAFPVGKWYNSAGELFEAVSKWASQYHFTVRKDGARIIKCSRAENTHSKKKAAKAKTVQIKQYSLACSCPFYLRFSLKQVDKGRVCITEVNGYHNHTLDLRSAELSQRLAVSSIGNSNQSTREKILKWQRMGPRWAHFSRNTVDGHRNVSTSTYAEQNHSSLKAKAPDNPKRKMERNVTDVMKRDRDLIEKRQLDKG